MTAMMLKSLQKVAVTIAIAILYHFHERTLILTQFKKSIWIDPKTREILDFLFFAFCYGSVILDGIRLFAA